MNEVFMPALWSRTYPVKSIKVKFCNAPQQRLRIPFSLPEYHDPGSAWYDAPPESFQKTCNAKNSRF